MDFINTIFDFIVEIYPNILYKYPMKFSKFFITKYILNEIEVCKNAFRDNYMHLCIDEIKEVYLQLMIYMYSEKNYNIDLLKYLNNYYKLKNLLDSDSLFQYQIFTLSIDNIKIYKYILYSTDKWYDTLSIKENESNNNISGSTSHGENSMLSFGNYQFQLSSHIESTHLNNSQNIVYDNTNVFNENVIIDSLSSDVSNLLNSNAALLDSEFNNTDTFNTESNNAESSNKESSNAESSNAESSNTESNNAESNNNLPSSSSQNSTSSTCIDIDSLSSGNSNPNQETNFITIRNEYVENTDSNKYVENTDTTTTGESSRTNEYILNGVSEPLSEIYYDNKMNLFDNNSETDNINENSNTESENYLEFEDNEIVANENTNRNINTNQDNSNNYNSIDNILVKQSNNIYTDYISIILILGGKFHLTLFLDWMRFHDKLHYFSNDRSLKYAIWFGIYNSKFSCVEILKKYGFKDTYSYAYKYKFINEYEYYKIVRIKNKNIFLKTSMYEHITLEEFKKKFCEINCSQYSKTILGSDEPYNIYSESFVQDWNADILYYLDFPKKIILCAISDLCLESNHLYCASISKIQEQCRLICIRNKVQVMTQLYLINKKENTNCLKKKFVDKMVARFYLNKSSSSHNECVICFDSLKNGSKITMLNCNHFLHNECLNEWRKEKNQCPYCRKDIFKTVNLLN